MPGSFSRGHISGYGRPLRLHTQNPTNCRRHTCSGSSLRFAASNTASKTALLPLSIAEWSRLPLHFAVEVIMRLAWSWVAGCDVACRRTTKEGVTERYVFTGPTPSDKMCGGSVFDFPVILSKTLTPHSQLRPRGTNKATHIIRLQCAGPVLFSTLCRPSPVSPDATPPHFISLQTI